MRHYTSVINIKANIIDQLVNINNETNNWDDFINQHYKADNIFLALTLINLATLSQRFLLPNKNIFLVSI